MLKTVLLTGGAGFIGSHTVDLLLNENKQVIVLDNFSSGKLENLDIIKSGTSEKEKATIELKSGNLVILHNKKL